MKKPLLLALQGERVDRPPFWLMRQAGRYLPEYRALRKEAGSFLNLCYNPKWASEVTIQPIRRFGMDAAILFSDILVIPKALGQGLNFVEGEGPRLDAICDGGDLAKLSFDSVDENLNSIYETVDRVSSELPPETTLIGFAGAVWTVACYMVEGGGSKDFSKVKKFAFTRPRDFAILMDLLIESTIIYLDGQINAGAEVIQLFDSHAGALSEKDFETYVINPTRIIVSRLREKHSDIPIIGFPRGASTVSLEEYAAKTGVTAIGLDTAVPQNWAAKNLQNHLPVQGNLDPIKLLAGGDVLKRATEEILSQFGKRSYIFNLGHGIQKETPPEHVLELKDILDNYF